MPTLPHLPARLPLLIAALACASLMALTGCGDDGHDTHNPAHSSPNDGGDTTTGSSLSWDAFWASDMGDREAPPRPLALGARTTLLLDCGARGCDGVRATVAPAGVVAVAPSANGIAVQSLGAGQATITLTRANETETHPIEVVEPARVWLSNSELELYPSWQPAGANPDAPLEVATFSADELTLFLHASDASGRLLGGREVVPLHVASVQGRATLSFDAGTRYVLTRDHDPLVQLVAGDGPDARVLMEIEPISEEQVTYDTAAVIPLAGMVFSETYSASHHIQSGDTLTLTQDAHVVHLLAQTPDGRPILGNGDRPATSPQEGTITGDFFMLGNRGAVVDASQIDTLSVRLDWFGTFEFTVVGALNAQP